MPRHVLLLGLGLLIIISAGARAELVEDDAPPRKPLTPLPEPKTEVQLGNPNQPAERLPFIVDEPGFKAKAVFPEQPVPKYEDARLGSAKVSRTIARKAWSLPQEEGLENAPARPDDPPAGESKDTTVEEISPALAKVIAKERSNKKLKDILPLYKEIVAAEPDSAAAHYRLGLALAKNQEIHSAAVELEKTVNLQPHNPKYMCDFGLIALQAGWLEKALLACQSAAVSLPSNARFQSALGDCLLSSGQVTQAADAYNRAVTLEPGNAEYIHNLSLAFLHGKVFKRCIEICNEAIKTWPDHAQYYCTRGLAQENTKNVAEAISDYKHAIAVDKNNAYAHYLLASTYSDPDDPTYTSAFEAIEHAGKAVQLTQQHNARYLMGLARALRVGHNMTQAAEAARKAVMIEPREDYKRELAQYEKLRSDSVNNMKP